MSKNLVKIFHWSKLATVLLKLVLSVLSSKLQRSPSFCDYIICDPRYFMIIFNTNFMNLSGIFFENISSKSRKECQFSLPKLFTYQQCTGKPLLGELGLSFQVQLGIGTFCPPQGHLIENSLEFQ